MEELEIDAESVLKEIENASKLPNEPRVILEECLILISDALEAERAAIMLYDSNFDKLNPIAVDNIDSETFFSSAEVSLSVIDKVYKEQRSLMSYDALSDPRFSDKLSVIISALRSFLCVPIKSNDGLMGLIYVDNRTKTKAYTHKHLMFLENCAQKLSEIINELFPNMQPKIKKL